MVLWIGYLQWHFRTHGKVNPPEPVLRDFHNIEHRDALIAYDAVELLRDEAGKPITRWDGITTKTSPITGEQVPDESAQVEQYRYINPRKAEWPQADYIVGNPPFIGASTMRRALGDGYVDAVRTTWKEVPESADFVMYWWHIAAELVRAGSCSAVWLYHHQQYQARPSIGGWCRRSWTRRIHRCHWPSPFPTTLGWMLAMALQVRIAMTVGAAGRAMATCYKCIDEFERRQNRRD